MYSMTVYVHNKLTDILFESFSSETKRYCFQFRGELFTVIVEVASNQSRVRNCPRRVLAQRPKPEEALIGPPAYKECEILV